MSVSSAAAVPAGLSASSGGAGKVGTADPLYDVRSIFTILGMTITQHDGIMNAHNLTGMDDFDYIRVDDTGSFIKLWNDTSQAVAMEVGMPIQINLQGFLYWYHDQENREMIPSEANFEATAMRLVVNEFDTEKADKELDLTDLDPSKI